MFDPAIDDSFNEPRQQPAHDRATGSSFARLSSGVRERSFAAVFGAIGALQKRSLAKDYSVGPGFAQPHPQARQLKPANDEPDCVRSAN